MGQNGGKVRMGAHIRWQIDPTREDFLVLDAIEYQDHGERRIHSLENRRLHCLNEHEDHVHPWTVMARLRCTKIPSANEILIRLAKRSGGSSVRVRGAS